MDSHTIQKWLYFYLCKKGHNYILPNKVLSNWFECDMVSVTKANYIHEYEIKISRSDFKKDFKKAGKHLYLEGKRTVTYDYWSEDSQILQSRFYYGDIICEGKEPETMTYDLSELCSPNYFWYVTPEGLLKEEEIPEYSGFIEIQENGDVITKKKAKKLHKEKVDEDIKTNIIETGYHRYVTSKFNFTAF